MENRKLLNLVYFVLFILFFSPSSLLALDSDSDGIPDSTKFCRPSDGCDNCNFVPNAPGNSRDLNGTCAGVKDTIPCYIDSQCDPTFPYTAWCSNDQEDRDSDGMGDVCDPCPDVAPIDDFDDDCVANSSDGCPNDSNKTAPGDCGCGNPDIHSDSDGVADCIDQCDYDSNKTVPGYCGCGVPETGDTDGDGTPDCNDACPLDSSRTEPGVCGCGSFELSDGRCATGTSLPDTGQQKCYNSSAETPCPTEGQSYYGQDANYRIGQASFTKLDINGNSLSGDVVSWSMVRDNISGLVWQALEPSDITQDDSDNHDPDNTYTWCYYHIPFDPEDNGGNTGSCSGTGLATTHALLSSMNHYPSYGNRSWRMPSVEELSKLLQHTDSPPLAHSFFPNMKEDKYWTGTTDKKDAARAWSVDFGTSSYGGSIQVKEKSLPLYTLVVSGELRRDSVRFTNNMDGTTTDRSTGLMWLTEPADLDHDGLADNLIVEEALAWAENLDFAGFSDWRLPNRNELQSLVDYTRHSPALDTAYFPGIHDDSSNPALRYWSSTTTLVNSSSVKGSYVEFAGGEASSISKNFTYGARAVRGGVAFEEGRISIAVPVQGSILNYGAGYDGGSITIKWNSGAIPTSESVYIDFSYDGGMTWQRISYFGQFVAGQWIEFDHVANSGEYSWMPSADSNNCVIKITPINSAYSHLAGRQELFSVRGLNPVYRISYEYNRFYCGPDNSDYVVSLTTNHEEGIFPAWAIWQITEGENITVGYETGRVWQSDHANRWFEVSTAFYGGQNFSRHLFFAKDSNSAIDEDDTYNHIPGYADPMEDGLFYFGLLDPADDIDYFTFSLAEDSMVNLGFVSRQQPCPTEDPRIPVTVEVINVASDVTVAIDITDDLTILPMGLSAGDYYVRLIGNDDLSSAGPYFLSYMIDGSRAYTSNPAAPVSLDSPPSPGAENIHSGLLNNLLDIVLYSFVVTETANLEIGFISGSDIATYQIEVKNEQDEVIFSNKALEMTPVSITGVFEPGTYTVEVTPVDRIDAFNPFRIYKKETDLVLEIEPNNTTETANQLFMNSPVNGRTSDDTDNDFYSFEVTSPSYLNLSLFCPYSDKDFTLILYKNSIDNPIDQITTVNGNNVSLHMGLSIGSYFLQVSPSGEAETSRYYTLLLQPSLRSSLEIEANNTIRFSNTIEEATPRTGRIYSSGDIDYFGFGFTPDSGNGTILIDFDSYSTSGSYKVSIVDINHIELDTETSTGGADLTLSATVLVGNYYVKVESAGVVDPYTHYELQATGMSGAISGLKSIVAIQVNGDTNQMTVGDTDTGSQELEAQAFYSNTVSSGIASATFDWLSLDPAVASVNSAGVVTAIGTGTTSIIASHSNIGDVVGKFDLVVGTASPDFQHHGNLILVSGGGPDESDNLYASTKYLSELIYSRFKSRFFSDEDIYFLSPTGLHDINGDGFNDDIVDDPGSNPTLAKLYSAINSWASSPDRNTDGPLYIYLLDHGSNDNFKVNTGQYLTSANLKSKLDSFQSTTGRQVVVMIEACKSGTFVSGPAADNLVTGGENRVVVTSTDNLDTYIQLNGRISFSQFFIDRLLTGDTIRQAYDATVTKLSNMGLPYTVMAPQIALGTGSDADQLIIGGNFGIGSLFPEFLSVSSGTRPIVANTSQNFSAQIADLDAVERVWAMVKGPDYQVPDLSSEFEAPTVEQEVIQYLKEGPVHSGSTANFQYNGEYKVSCYAMNSNGNVTQAPETLTLNVSGGLVLPGDVNGVNGVDLIDGIMVLQAIAGLNIGGIVADFPTSGADVDGDGRLGLSEAIMIMQNVARQ